VNDRVARYGIRLACCLSRGCKAPLNKGDVEQVAGEIAEQGFARGTFVFRREAAKVHIVRSGSVGLSRIVNEQRVMLHLLQPGLLSLTGGSFRWPSAKRVYRIASPSCFRRR
jgi:hypothetical protein